MRSGRSGQREGSCYQSVNFGTKRPNCVGPDRYLIWPFLLPISLKFYRLFQGERTDRSMYYPFMDYYITELTAKLLENGGRYQAQYLIPMNLPRLTPDRP